MWFCVCFTYYNILLLFFLGIVIVDGGIHNTMYNRAATIWQTIYVDQSGRGNFTNIQSAIDSVPSNNNKWICIYITAAIYKEQVQIPRDKQFIYMRGEGKWKTSIVWDARDSIDTSATFSVFADNFVAKSITFVNAFNYPWNMKNPRKVAVAAWIYGDKNSFYRCGFVGLQDTLWDCLGRHYFYLSSIVGAVDFIFGAGQSIYERCTISVTGEALEGAGYITAQGKSNAVDSNGFVFKDCNVVGTGFAYLGRPWRDYATVLFYNSTFSNVIVPDGWSSWDSAGHEYRLTFAENLCNGPGSDNTGRVKWEKKLSPEQLQEFTSISFIDNEGWIATQPFNMLAY